MSDDEVRIELKVDDRSEDAIKHAESNFKGLAEEIAKAMHEAGHKGGEEVAEGVFKGEMMKEGFDVLKEGAEKAFDVIKEKFEEAFEAAGVVEQQKRALTGMMALTGKVGESFDDMQDQANLFHESLEQTGIEAGVTAQQMIDAFSGIAERTGKSAVEVEELTRQMAYAGKAVPGGMGALQSGFEAIEQGVVRARNPIVQMIASTGMLHGNAKQVAAQMQKLTPEAQIELATRAMSKMGEKMKDMPPTMAELKTSFNQIQETMAASLGEPMVQALVPQLDELKGWLQEHSVELAQGRKELGKFLGEELTKEADTFKEIAKIFKTDTKEGSETIKDAGNWWKASIDASMLSVNWAMKGIAMAAAGLGMAAHDTKEWLKGKAEEGTFGTTAQAGLLTGEAKSFVGGSADPETKKQLDEVIEKMEKAALARTNAGEDSPELAAFEEKIEALRNAAEAQAHEGEAEMQAVQQVSTSKIAEYYNRAIENHEDGQRLYMAKLLAGSEEAQDALLKSGDAIKDGYSGLVEAMKEVGQKEAAEKFAEKAKAAASAEGKKNNPVVNISGGIQIHQDFRDQDPDRVVIAMRRDIAKNAENRIAARTGLPFGA